MKGKEDTRKLRFSNNWEFTVGNVGRNRAGKIKGTEAGRVLNAKGTVIEKPETFLYIKK